MIDLLKIFKKTIEFGFYLLFFLVPLILTPWNYELFEFNKMLLVYGLTVIIVGAWVGSWILERKISIQTTPFDLPILLFLTSQLLSTLFSLDRHTSLFGYYSRFHGGLFSTLSYILLYYAFVSYLTNNKQATNHSLKNEDKQFHKFSNQKRQKLLFNYLFFLLSSAALVTFYGILEHFGIDAKYWVQDVRNRVFSTLGQPNWLGAWIDGLIMIPIALLINSQATPPERIKKYFYYFLFFIFYFCLLFTGSRSAYIGFLSTLLVFMGLLFLSGQLKQVKKPLSLVLGGTILISFLFGTPLTPSFLKSLFPPNPVANQTAIQKKEPILISSSTEIRKVVWAGAFKIWQKWPIFGSGVETFAYSYYNFRPREHNDLSEWDFLYNKAHNEYLNYLATTGIVGLGTHLLLVFWILVWSLKQAFNHLLMSKKSKDQKINHHSSFNSPLLFSLLAGYFSILVTNFFGFSVVPVAVLFWLFPAFILALTANQKEALVFNLAPVKVNLDNIRKKEKFLAKHQSLSLQTTKKLNNLQKTLLLILCLLAGYFLWLILKLWLADFHFNQGKKYNEANYFLPAQKELLEAVKLSPNEPFFRTILAENSAMMALAYHQQDKEKNQLLIEELSQMAQNQVQTVLKLNPYHLNYYRSAAKTYLYLAQINPNFYLQAIALLEKGHELAPTEPKITYNLGLIFQQLEQKDKALAYLEKTIELKPNYLAARLTLAKLYHELGQKEAALNQLKYILEKLDPENEETLYWLKEWQ